MNNFKTQFEARFGVIYNFKEIYKEIIAPYIKLHEINCSIDPLSNGFSERCAIIYRAELYSIELRWDRMIFISEGHRDDLLLKNGPFYYFFELLTKIVTFSSGGIRDVILAEWNIIPIEDKDENLVDSFSSRFFSNLRLNSVFEKEKKDIGLILEFRDDPNEFKLKTGPFDYKKDVANFTLNQIANLPLDTFSDIHGYIIEAMYVFHTKECNHNTYIKMHRFIKSKIDQLYER